MDLVTQTSVVRRGLSALREDHYSILARLEREEWEEDHRESDEPNLAGRVARSLDKVEEGIEESEDLLLLNEHFRILAASRERLRSELGRAQEENDWLRRELADAQRRRDELEVAAATGARLQEEKKDEKEIGESRFEPQDEGKQVSPRVRPSRIPVLLWRLREEKDANRERATGMCRVDL